MENSHLVIFDENTIHSLHCIVWLLILIIIDYSFYRQRQQGGGH